MKKIAQELQIKYSTAKTILRIFKIERRIDKKNGVSPDRELRNVFLIEKQNKNQGNNNLSSIPYKGKNKSFNYIFFKIISYIKYILMNKLFRLDFSGYKNPVVNHVTPTFIHQTFQEIQNEISSLSPMINEFNEKINFIKDILLKSFEQLNLTNNIIKELTNFHQKVYNLHSSIFNRTNIEENLLFSANHSENKYFTFNFNFNCSFFGTNQNLISFPVDGQMNETVKNLYPHNKASDNICKKY